MGELSDGLDGIAAIDREAVVLQHNRPDAVHRLSSLPVSFISHLSALFPFPQEAVAPGTCTEGACGSVQVKRGEPIEEDAEHRLLHVSAPSSQIIKKFGNFFTISKFLHKYEMH